MKSQGCNIYPGHAVAGRGRNIDRTGVALAIQKPSTIHQYEFDNMTSNHKFEAGHAINQR